MLFLKDITATVIRNKLFLYYQLEVKIGQITSAMNETEDNKRHIVTYITVTKLKFKLNIYIYLHL